MGVDTRLVVYAPDETTASSACQAAFDRVADLEDIMSDYRPTSELMRLCAQSGGPPVKISNDLYQVLSFGQLISAQSDGAFDMTVGPLVQVWRQARKTHVFPSSEAIAQAMAVTGYGKLTLDPATRTARLAVRGMRLDLGGIAKGYAGDEAILTLREHGVRAALFQAGGDIVVSDAPPGAGGWSISIPHPPARRLVVSNCAISTSGDSNQFVEFDGKRYSHIINPHTGLGLTGRTLVTIVAPTGLMSDPLSKAGSILPAERFEALLAVHPKTRAYVRQLGLGENP